MVRVRDKVRVTLPGHIIQKVQGIRDAADDAIVPRPVAIISPTPLPIAAVCMICSVP